MGQLSFNDPIINQPDSTEEPKIPAALDQIKQWANGATPGTPGGGNIDVDNFHGAFLKTLFVATSQAGITFHSVSFGGGSFPGNNSDTIQVSILHNLAAGSAPQFIIVLPSLASTPSGVGAWTAPYGQYQAADSAFYIEFQQPAYGGSIGGAPTEFGFPSSLTYFYNFMAIGS